MNIYSQSIDFRKTKPQKYLDQWNGNKKTHIIFMGVCPICETRMYGMRDEPYGDPRGPIGRHTASFLEPENYGYAIGDTFNVCFECLNNRETYEKALSIAKKGWSK